MRNLYSNDIVILYLICMIALAIKKYKETCETLILPKNKNKQTIHTRNDINDKTILPIDDGHLQRKLSHFE